MPLTDTTREEIIQIMLEVDEELPPFIAPDLADRVIMGRYLTAIEPIINRLIAEARDKALEDAAVSLSLTHDSIVGAGDWDEAQRVAFIEGQRMIRALKTKDNPHG